MVAAIGRPRALFLFAFGLGLVVRLGALLVSHLTTPYVLHGDAVLYDELARNMLYGAGYVHAGHPTGIVLPGYPLFVAGVYAMTNGSVAMVGVAQALLGALSVALVAAVALELAGTVAGVAAGAMAAVYPHFVSWTEEVLTETLFVALAMTALWCLVRLDRTGRLGYAIGAGAALTGAMLVRSELLLFVPLAAVVAWLRGGQGRLAVWAAILVAPTLTMVVWTARNAQAVGVASTATESASVLWNGVNPDAARLHSGGYVYSAPLPEPPAAGASESEIYDVYMHAVQTSVSRDPLAIVRPIPAKLANMWRPAFDGSKLTTWVILGGAYVVVLILAAVGIATRAPDGAAWYLYAYAASITLVHALTIAEIRYRMPVEAALIALAGVGASYLVRRARRAPAAAYRGDARR